MSACVDCKDFKRPPFKVRSIARCMKNKLNFYGKCQTFDSMDEFNGKPDPCVPCTTGECENCKEGI
jgi:hypothetical protein